MLKQHTVLSRCNSHCKYHHSNMYCIFYSLVKEYSSSNKHPPPLLLAIFCIGRVKVYSNKCPPQSELCLLDEVHLCGVFRSSASTLAYPKLEKFMLYFAKGYKLWRRNPAACTSYTMCCCLAQMYQRLHQPSGEI